MMIQLNCNELLSTLKPAAFSDKDSSPPSDAGFSPPERVHYWLKARQILASPSDRFKVQSLQTTCRTKMGALPLQ